MECPHCGKGIHYSPTKIRIGCDSEVCWQLEGEICPECTRLILYLESGQAVTGRSGQKPGPHIKVDGDWHVPTVNKIARRLVNPPGPMRPIPPEVLQSAPEVAEDFVEACLVLPFSPKASAALSRRCLQHVLVNKAGVTSDNLHNQIQEVIDSQKLPSMLADSLHHVRVIGNFAAHANKSKTTGEIVAVEPDEAEWNLDVLESLFDVYYVMPAKVKAKRDALDKKQKDAQKMP